MQADGRSRSTQESESHSSNSLVEREELQNQPSIRSKVLLAGRTAADEVADTEFAKDAPC